MNGKSVEMRKTIEPLIPSSLSAAVKAGPIEGSMWCLIIDNNAAAAKIRQLSPSLEAHLRSKGWDVKSIKIKIQTSRNN